MKTFIAFIFYISFFNLNSQVVTYMAIKTNDCSLCLTSYKAIARIDTKLNPTLVFENLDSATILYFRNEFLKTNLPYVVDSSFYKSLLDEYGQSQFTVMVNNEVKFKCLSKFMPEHLNQINSIANSFDLKFLETLNDSLKGKLIGYKDIHQFEDQLSIYSEISNKMLLVNLKKASISTLQFDDSIMYETILKSESKSSSVKSKRFFYRKELISLIDEFRLLSHLFFKDKLFLYVSVLDYERMMSKAELNENGNVAWPKTKQFILECEVLNGKLKIVNQYELEKKNKRQGYNYTIWIVNNKPALFYSLNKETEIYDRYIDLSSSKWNNFRIFKRRDLLFKTFSGNTIYNQYSYNRLSNVLVDDSLNVALKFSKYGYDTVMFYDIKHNDSIVYLTLLDVVKQVLFVYKIDTKAKKFDILKTYDKLSPKNHFFFSYIDVFTKKMYVIGLKEPNTTYLLGEISLE